MTRIIASARSDVPALVAEVRRLQEALRPRCAYIQHGANDSDNAKLDEILLEALND